MVKGAIQAAKRRNSAEKPIRGEFADFPAIIPDSTARSTKFSRFGRLQTGARL
jgi:hypothetical protein